MRPHPARSGGTRGGGGSKGNETRGRGAHGGDGDAHGGRARVGRYQLIREFLRRKTGKVRSLQQIGSRMQHLRRAHAGDAYSACQPLPLLKFPSVSVSTPDSRRRLIVVLTERDSDGALALGPRMSQGRLCVRRRQQQQQPSRDNWRSRSAVRALVIRTHRITVS